MKILFKSKRLKYIKSYIEIFEHSNYLKWLNDSEITKNLGGTFTDKKVTLFEAKQYLKKLNPNKSLFLFLFTRKDNVHIGNIHLSNINKKKKSAIIGILIGEKEYLGKGYGFEAVYTTTQYALNNLNLKKIYAHIFVDNIQSQKTFEKAGYKQIKLLKNYILKNNIFYDNYLYCYEKNQ